MNIAGNIQEDAENKERAADTQASGMQPAEDKRAVGGKDTPGGLGMDRGRTAPWAVQV